ncbi:MAG TPA: PQQ-binding-like beta-propeller repeat protein [Thermoanaerobaculia bacterium]
MTRSFLLLALNVLIVFFSAALGRADLRLQQKEVVGFPADGALEIAQIDPDGVGAHRLVVLHETYLMGLQWSPQRNAYDQTFFVLLDFGLFANHMVLADVNGDSRDDVVVTGTDNFAHSSVKAYDAQTGALLKTMNLNLLGAIAQDIDGIPGNEIIVGGASAYKGDVLLWHSPIPGVPIPASRLVSTRGEIFLRAANEVIVLDARTGQERRRLPATCLQAAVGQSDLDGIPDIVCGSQSDIQLIDGVTGAVRWRQPLPYTQWSLHNLMMFDANGDGLDEVVVRWETGIYKQTITVLSGATGLPYGSKTLDDGGPVIGVTSGCDFRAIAAIEGKWATHSDNLWLFEGATLDTKSAFSFDDYGTTGFAIGDFDGEGRNELAVTHDGKVSFQQLEPGSPGDTVNAVSSCCTYRGMAALQLDHDAASEYVVAGVCGGGYVGCLVAWDRPTAAPLWTATMDDGEIPRTVTVADVDGDGSADVLSMSIAVHSGAKGQFVYAFRGRDGKLLWRSISVPGSTGRVRVADVEGKGRAQVLALSSTIGIVRLNLSNGSVSGFNEFKDGSAFATYMVAGDPRAKMVVAAGDRLFILDDGQTKAEVHSAELVGTTEIEVVDIDGDGVPEILLARRSDVSISTVHLQVRSIDTLAPLWTSEEFPRLLSFGRVEQISVGDVDNDGVAEVVFLSSIAMRVFKVDGVASGTIPPRFDPSAGLRANVASRSCCVTVNLQWDHAQPGTSPPLQYRVYRAGTAGGPEVLLATTSRNEFTDLYVTAGAGYGYSVEVIDAAGHAAPRRLTTEAKVPICHRPAGRR